MKHFLGNHPEFQIETDPKLTGLRSRTLIIKAMTKSDEKNDLPFLADKNCPYCRGKGYYYVSDGHDDVNGEVCECVLKHE